MALMFNYSALLLSAVNALRISLRSSTTSLLSTTGAGAGSGSGAGAGSSTETSVSTTYSTT